MKPIQALHHPLQDDPGGKRLRVEADYDAYVRQLIEQVLLTNPGERIHRPEFGAGLARLVFQPLGPVTVTLAQTLAYKALRETLSDIIRVDAVEVAHRGSQLDITVIYTLYARMEQRRLNLEVTA